MILQHIISSNSHVIGLTSTGSLIIDFVDFASFCNLALKLSVCDSPYDITGVATKAGLDVRGRVPKSLSRHRDDSASVQRTTAGEYVGHLEAVSDALGAGSVKSKDLPSTLQTYTICKISLDSTVNIITISRTGLSLVFRCK